MSPNVRDSIRRHARNPSSLVKSVPPPSKSDLERLLAFNLKHHDNTQGQTFEEWIRDGLMLQLISVMKNYNSMKVPACFNKRFKNYDTFPSNSNFHHPTSVPPDAGWASMHLEGKPCIAGHIVDNVFFVVFLDAHHQFSPSELKHT